MNTVNEHLTSHSLEQHVQNMVRLLAQGDAHFLIGGSITPFGIKPVTFTRNVSDELRQLLTQATPVIVANLMAHTLSTVNPNETH